MKKLKILHTADMHLAAEVSVFDYEKNSIRKREIQESAMKVFEMCRDADIVLLAGDIFDSGDCSERIADMICSEIFRCSHAHFFMSCGNHDPYSSRIIRYLEKLKPLNLHIFTPDLQCITIEDMGVRVYGASFDTQYCESSLIDSALPCDGEYINLLCIHGELTESGKSVYNPLSVSQIEALGFDYAALGHVHSFSGIKRSGNLSYAYCGVHEPNGFDECGKKGCIIGEISHGRVDLAFVPVAKREYIDDYIDISDAQNYADLIKIVSEKTISSDNICRFSFVGQNRIGADINCNLISSRVDCFYLSLTDSSDVEIDFSALADDVSLKGLCAGEIVHRLKNALPDETIRIHKAGRLLFDILDGRGEGIDY